MTFILIVFIGLVLLGIFAPSKEKAESEGKNESDSLSKGENYEGFINENKETIVNALIMNHGEETKDNIIKFFDNYDDALDIYFFIRPLIYEHSAFLRSEESKAVYFNVLLNLLNNLSQEDEKGKYLIILDLILKSAEGYVIVISDDINKNKKEIFEHLHKDLIDNFDLIINKKEELKNIFTNYEFDDYKNKDDLMVDACMLHFPALTFLNVIKEICKNDELNDLIDKSFDLLVPFYEYMMRFIIGIGDKNGIDLTLNYMAYRSVISNFTDNNIENIEEDKEEIKDLKNRINNLESELNILKNKI